MPPPFDPSGSFYPQDTYLGRTRNFFRLFDPRTLLITDAELEVRVRVRARARAASARPLVLQTRTHVGACVFCAAPRSQEANRVLEEFSAWRRSGATARPVHLTDAKVRGCARS
jgi:hypothetical protein